MAIEKNALPQGTFFTGSRQYDSIDVAMVIGLELEGDTAALVFSKVK